jgi:hypothetical protein
MDLGKQDIEFEIPSGLGVALPGGARVIARLQEGQEVREKVAGELFSATCRHKWEGYRPR